MKISKLILLFLALSLSFSCTQNASSAKTMVSQKENISDKNLKELQNIYAKMEVGFKANDFSPYYNYLDEKAIVINGQGEEVHGKEHIIEHFNQQLEQFNFELIHLNIKELNVSNELALGTSEYTARLHNKTNEMKVQANWHLVWKKDGSNKWKIYREIYNMKK